MLISSHYTSCEATLPMQRTPHQEAGLWRCLFHQDQSNRTKASVYPRQAGQLKNLHHHQQRQQQQKQRLNNIVWWPHYLKRWHI